MHPIQKTMRMEKSLSHSLFAERGMHHLQFFTPHSRWFHTTSRGCYMHPEYKIATLFFVSMFHLVLPLFIGGVVALFSRRTRHVKWTLTTLAGTGQAWLIGVSVAWLNLGSWQVLVLFSLAVWVVLDWSSKKLRRESLIRSYGDTWLVAVLKSTAILVGCSLVAIVTAPHHL